jgi:hypothetical protein
MPDNLYDRLVTDAENYVRKGYQAPPIRHNRSSLTRRALDYLRPDRRPLTRAASDQVRDTLGHDKKGLVGSAVGGVVGPGVSTAAGQLGLTTGLGAVLTVGTGVVGTLATAGIGLGVAAAVGATAFGLKKAYDRHKKSQVRTALERHRETGAVDKVHDNLRYLLSHGELMKLAHHFDKCQRALAEGWDAFHDWKPHSSPSVCAAAVKMAFAVQRVLRRLFDRLIQSEIYHLRDFLDLSLRKILEGEEALAGHYARACAYLLSVAPRLPQPREVIHTWGQDHGDLKWSTDLMTKAQPHDRPALFHVITAGERQGDPGRLTT